MKCTRHPERDAIGICITCGRALCEDCKLSVQGKLYCKDCVESGRATPSMPFEMPTQPEIKQITYPPPAAFYYPSQPQSVARPLSSSNSALYLYGGYASISAGIFTIILGIGILFIFMKMSSARYDSTHCIAAVLPSTMLYFIFILAVIFVAAYMIRGVAFFGLYQSYNTIPALIALVFSMIGAIVFLFLLCIGSEYRTVTVYSSSYYSYYSTENAILFSMLFWLAPIMLGVGGIITGVMLIIMRRFAVKPPLMLAAGIIMIIGGGFLAGLIGILGIGLFLLAVGDILFGASLLLDTKLKHVETEVQGKPKEEGGEGAEVL